MEHPDFAVREGREGHRGTLQPGLQVAREESRPAPAGQGLDHAAGAARQGPEPGQPAPELAQVQDGAGLCRLLQGPGQHPGRVRAGQQDGLWDPLEAPGAGSLEMEPQALGPGPGHEGGRLQVGEGVLARQPVALEMEEVGDLVAIPGRQERGPGPVVQGSVPEHDQGRPPFPGLSLQPAEELLVLLPVGQRQQGLVFPQQLPLGIPFRAAPGLRLVPGPAPGRLGSQGTLGEEALPGQDAQHPCEPLPHRSLPHWNLRVAGC